MSADGRWEVTKDIIKPQQTAEEAMMEIIKLSVGKGMGADEIAHLKSMYDDMVKEKAAKAFAEAMNRAQGKMPAVVKDAKNDFNKSRFARLEAVSTVIKPVYTDEGFSLTFGTDKSDIEGHIRIWCDITHKDGCVKRIYGDFALDDAGSGGKVNKTEIQATGSTYSYARRYLTLMAFNVTIAEEDVDGVHSQANSLINEEQVKELNALVDDCARLGSPVNIDRLNKHLHQSDWTKLRHFEYMKAKDFLQRCQISALKNGGKK